MAFTVVYDACVLYPVRLRDLLLRAAYTPALNLRARVSDTLLDELGRALVAHSAMPSERWTEHRAQIADAVPDFFVSGYEPLIEAIELPDPDDRHVVAAAVRGQASAIVTFNLKDFPSATLDRFDIQAVHPDEFCLSLLDQSGAAFVDLLHQQLAALRRPPVDMSGLLDNLDMIGLPVTARRLRDELSSE